MGREKASQSVKWSVIWVYLSEERELHGWASLLFTCIAGSAFIQDGCI